MSRNKNRQTDGNKPAATPIKNENPIVRKLAIQQSFSGPLPPPDLLGQYDAILPGLADRIVKMAEKQESHRHELENRVVKAEINRSYFGMASGLVVA